MLTYPYKNKEVIHMQLPTRKRNRLTEYDYSMANAYFITICTKHRKNLFWVNAGATVELHTEIPLTELGEIVQQRIEDISGHYPTISVDHFVIMPNHIHILLQIHTDGSGRPMAAPTVSTVMNQLKGTVSKAAGFSVWQKGFYDHVIRSERDYLEIWNYIEGNPGKWSKDELYTL